MSTTSKHRIAIFASGAGSNAQAIIEYFKPKPSVEVVLLVCNKPNAGVISIAEAAGVPVEMIDRAGFYQDEEVLFTLQSLDVDWIVLAGFLWLVPKYLVKGYPHRIINIHPALLPDFGGKGMYGMNVHQAVLDAGMGETGITIHYVDEEYDKGEYIFQTKVAIGEQDTPESLAQKVHQLEHQHYPQVIEQLLIEAGD